MFLIISARVGTRPVFIIIYYIYKCTNNLIILMYFKYLLFNIIHLYTIELSVIKLRRENKEIK